MYACMYNFNFGADKLSNFFIKFKTNATLCSLCTTSYCNAINACSHNTKFSYTCVYIELVKTST